MERNYIDSDRLTEIAGDCPECGKPLYYTKSDKSVECPYCGRVIEIRDIKPLGSVRKSDSSENSLSAAFAKDIDDPESALIYVENFYKNYDWSAYKQTPSIEIPEIDTIVEKNKTKYGADPISWILHFESKILPLTKKLEGLEDLEEVFVSQYRGLDSTNLLPKYHLYERITNSIKENAEKIFADLGKDIEYAKRLEADEETVLSMKQRFNSAVHLYNDNVFDFNSFTEIPAVMEAIELRSNAVTKALDDQGIDAAATYEKAVKLYNASKNKSNALRLFEVVKDYKDSAEYIKRINAFFNFDSKIIRLADKHFLIKRFEPPVFNVRKPQDVSIDVIAKESSHIPIREARPTFSIYEIIGGKAYEPAVVSGVSSVLSFYGNKLFYIKRDRCLCSYDIFTHEETKLDEGNVGDYVNEPPFWNKDKSALFIRKRLSPALGEKRDGCIKAFFSSDRKKRKKKKKSTFVDTKNNFKLLRIDRKTGGVTVEIERFIDIVEFYNDRMFYIAYNSLPQLSYAPSYMMLDLRTGEKSRVLGDDCHIHNVIGDNVIFTTWDPNEYNQMLYSYNIKTKITTLIEANILGYFNTVSNRVYYRVGNKKYAPLFSNSLAGTDRKEIMSNAKEFYDVYDGRIYFFRGNKRNYTFLKMSPDGKETVPICTNVGFILAMKDVYVYYFDTKKTLHVVRNDGKNDRAIANDIDTSNIVIDKDYIYFLREEQVKREKSSYSLYRMDIDGSNIKKLLFDVDKIQNYDENYLYVYTCNTTVFERTEAVDDTVRSVDRVRRKVSRFYIFDKRSGVKTLLLTVGVPNDETRYQKRGCLRRKLKYNVEFKETSDKIAYKKEGLARAGQVYAQQTYLNAGKKY